MCSRVGRSVRRQVRTAGELRVEGFKLSCRIEKQRRSIATVAENEGDLAPEEGDARALHGVERVRFQGRHEPLDCV